MSTASESFILPSEMSASDPPDEADDDEVDSLPSTTTGSSLDDNEVYSDADREWRESLQQLELLLTIFVIPYVGKYFGRKAAYWGWAKFMQWKYPIEVVFTSPAAFKAAGAVQAAAPL